ncbi:hypothetical protein TorRG33x02_056850 [Trema orientale]|uniref:Uncharacterized protein n=1 Tax=Trema orientale TaxID=63057 RepID=A0A2P5FKY3_TREOI|nr:hypothetical protein TorRG33x02_056850 [Trema orientale]
MRQRFLSDQVTFSSVSHGVPGDSSIGFQVFQKLNLKWTIVLSKLLAGLGGAEPDRLVEELDWMECTTTPETESSANGGLAKLDFSSSTQHRIIKYNACYSAGSFIQFGFR